MQRTPVTQLKIRLGHHPPSIPSDRDPTTSSPPPSTPRRSPRRLRALRGLRTSSSSRCETTSYDRGGYQVAYDRGGYQVAAASVDSRALAGATTADGVTAGNRNSL